MDEYSYITIIGGSLEAVEHGHTTTWDILAYPNSLSQETRLTVTLDRLTPVLSFFADQKVLIKRSANYALSDDAEQVVAAPVTDEHWKGAADLAVRHGRA